MKRHRLRREIIATVVANDMVNLCGPTFPGRLRAAAGCDTAELVTAFEAARQVLRFDEAWARVEALDGKTPAAGPDRPLRRAGPTSCAARPTGWPGAPAAAPPRAPRRSRA